MIVWIFTPKTIPYEPRMTLVKDITFSKLIIQRLKGSSVFYIAFSSCLLSIYAHKKEWLSLYLVKTAWSFWSNTMIISPGSSPGSWSPSPWNVIFWPSFMPKHRSSLYFYWYQRPDTKVRIIESTKLQMWSADADFSSTALCQGIQSSVSSFKMSWPLHVCIPACSTCLCGWQEKKGGGGTI